MYNNRCYSYSKRCKKVAGYSAVLRNEGKKGKEELKKRRRTNGEIECSTVIHGS